MKVIKPLKLGIMHRVFESKRRSYLSVGIYAYFAFERPARLLPEIGMWAASGKALGPGEVLDEGLPKPEPEVTVHGSALPPGDPQPACRVRLQLGDIDKTLYVIGHRRWRHGVASEPELFTAMPVDWAHAFGGDGFAANPAGKGIDPAPGASGQPEYPLPNIEDPRRMIKSLEDRPAPVGFGARDISSPERVAYAGSYDDDWQENHFPGFPADFDAHYFQTAPADQWLKQLTGRERFSIDNMHPGKGRIEGGLPHMQARCFVTRTGGDKLEEVAMRPETLRLFPNIARGVLIYRGVVEIEQDDAADIAQLMIAADDIGAARPLSHYQTVLSQRLDKEHGALYALRDADLLPASALEGEPLADETFDDMADKLTGESLLAANLRRKAEQQLASARAQLIAQGLDPQALDVYALPPEPEPIALDEVPEHVIAQQAEAERQRKEAEEKREQAVAQAREQLKAQGMDYDEMAAAAEAKAGGPPSFRAADELRKLTEQLELSRNAGVPLPEVERQLSDPELFEKLKQTEEQLLGAYRRYAVHFPAAHVAADARSMELRDAVLHAYRSGSSLDAVDLTGANLSGLNLVAIDLSGAFLEGADLSGADLSGANLSNTMLVRANLSGAQMKGATLTGANFGGAKIHNADLSGSRDATRAIFAHADIYGSDLSGAELSEADMLEAKLVDCKLDGVRAQDVLFFDCTLSNVSFRGARLTKCIFIQVDLAGADFRKVLLSETTFVQCSGEGARFSEATADNLRMVKGCAFRKADFSRAKLNHANLRETDLYRASFSEAQLEGADLSGSNLQGASFYRAYAPSSMWIRADLRRANLFQLNAMLAFMSKAQLQGANLEHANLVRAELSRVATDRHTKLSGADLTQARYRKEATV